MSFYSDLWIKKAASWGSLSAPGPDADHAVTDGRAEATLGRGRGAVQGSGRVLTVEGTRILGAVAAAAGAQQPGAPAAVPGVPSACTLRPRCWDGSTEGVRGRDTTTWLEEAVPGPRG